MTFTHELREHANHVPDRPRFPVAGAGHYWVDVEFSEVVYIFVRYFMVLNADMVKASLSPYFGLATALA